MLDVSARGAEGFAIFAGQHRWATIRRVHGAQAPVVCNVHTGLSRQDEAELFYAIDRTRRRLTGWVRWWARRGAGDPDVLAIEAIAEHDLTVEPSTKDGTVRATKALEAVVALGGLTLLDSTLGLLVAAWGRVADALGGVHIHGLALVIHHYRLDEEMSPDRLVHAMQTIAPRQAKARAGQQR